MGYTSLHPPLLRKAWNTKEREREREREREERIEVRNSPLLPSTLFVQANLIRRYDKSSPVIFPPKSCAFPPKTRIIERSLAICRNRNTESKRELLLRKVLAANFCWRRSIPPLVILHYKRILFTVRLFNDDKSVNLSWKIVIYSTVHSFHRVLKCRHWFFPMLMY